MTGRTDRHAAPSMATPSRDVAAAGRTGIDVWVDNPETAQTLSGRTPFTEDELRAARAQNAIADCAAAFQQFADALRSSIEQEQERSKREAMRRQRRIDQARAWLREQEAVQRGGGVGVAGGAT